MSEKTQNKNENLEIPNTPLAFLIHVSKPVWVPAVLSILAVVFASALSQGSSYLFKLIVDSIEIGNTHNAYLWGLMFPILMFLVQILYRASGFLAAKWAVAASDKNTTNELVGYLLQHSHTYYSDRFAGSILSKMQNVSGAVSGLIPDILWSFTDAVVTFIVTFILMFTVSKLVAMIFLLLVVVLILSNRLFLKEKTRLSRENAEAGTALRGRVVDVFSGVSAMRQYVRREYESKNIKQLTDNKYEAGVRTWWYTEKMLLLNGLILFVFAFAMFSWLVYQWSLNNIGTGDFVLILSLVSQVTGTLLFIGRAFNTTARALGEMQEGLDDILVPHELSDSPDADILKVKEATIDWKEVNFEYGKNKVFKDFNLNILAGQRVGLVGPSGAGKTTFVSLLLRQHDIDSGAIEIDGQNIAEVTQDSLRENIAVVPQEPMLFHRSIRENIAYGNPYATEEEIIEVAKKAQAHDFIISLPEGYDTLVGERGVKLSGGQKQRVAIARAMLKDAPILILDEATSALDSESEVAIQKALDELMKGKTVVAVAHRLSTLREMDRIIVMNEGKVVEDGNHDTLVGKGGVYARLWNHQAGGFLQD